MKRYLLLLPLVVLLAACGSSPVHVTEKPSPTPTPSFYRLGQVVAVPGWQITLASAKTAKNIGLLAPAQQGDSFLMVQVTLRNTSSASATASDTSFFCLGNDATKYALIAANTPGIDGPVAAGHTASGQVTYEVPASAHQFTIQYKDDAGKILAVWQLSA